VNMLQSTRQWELTYYLGYDPKLIPPYSIKYGSGLIRAKTDKIDARRIREFAERFMSEIYSYKPENNTIIELREILSTRYLLCRLKRSVTNHIKSKNKLTSRFIYSSRLEVEILKYLRQVIKSLNKELDDTILGDSEILDNYNLISTIKGVGRIIGCYIIVFTDNFKRISTAKKAAAYTGVCPFPNESGTYVASAKSHFMKNRFLKSLLYISSISLIGYNKTFREYYYRKKRQGKCHKVIMNCVINKLLRTIYALVRDRQVYQDHFVREDPMNIKGTCHTAALTIS